jgi:hypothetical protein
VCYGATPPCLFVGAVPPSSLALCLPVKEILVPLGPFISFPVDGRADCVLCFVSAEVEEALALVLVSGLGSYRIIFLCQIPAHVLCVDLAGIIS